MEVVARMSVTTDQVWDELKKEIFAVVGIVTARGESRTVGVVYLVRGRMLFFCTDANAWKTKHLRNNPNVSVTVPIAKRIPFLPWIKIPPATITFSGTARVLDYTEVPPEIPDALLKGLQGAEELKKDCSVVEITPTGDFLTYGVGVSLSTMRRPTEATGRAPVA
jgi:hypothetical protein